MVEDKQGADAAAEWKLVSAGLVLDGAAVHRAA